MKLGLTKGGDWYVEIINNGWEEKENEKIIKRST